MELSEHEKELFDEFFKNLKATDKTLPIDCFFPDSKCYQALKIGFVNGLRKKTEWNEYISVI